MTTQAQIQAMREVCSKLEADPIITWARVEDWGQFGNFMILVAPNRKGRGVTQAIRARLQRCLSGTGARIRTLYAPDPVYECDRDTRRRVKGYQRDYWVIDVDYETYYPEINRFQSQLNHVDQ